MWLPTSFGNVENALEPVKQMTQHELWRAKNECHQKGTYSISSNSSNRQFGLYTHVPVASKDETFTLLLCENEEALEPFAG